MILTIVSVIIAFFLILKVYLKLICAVCRSKHCLVGKVAIVTGGCSGIGYEIAAGLAARGCKVIIADLIQDPAVREKLVKETCNNQIEIKYVDFSSFQSVRRFVDEIKVVEEKIDILINNVGTAFGYEKKTADGLNYCMQVNYFSPFLLTHLLISLLKKSSSGRIIFTSSIWAMLITGNLNQINQKLDYFFVSYAASKYCSLVASDVFAEKLKGTSITSNCYHPGAVYTQIFERAMTKTFLFNILLWVQLIFAYALGKSSEEAAQVPVHLACSDEVKNVSGGFFYETKRTFRPLNCTKADVKRAIWKYSEEAAGLKPSEKL